MIKRLLLVVALVVVLASALTTARAESVCSAAGASNPAGRVLGWHGDLRAPTVCVPVP